MRLLFPVIYIHSSPTESKKICGGSYQARVVLQVSRCAVGSVFYHLHLYYGLITGDKTDSHAVSAPKLKWNLCI
jgi:hypothetical protein